MQGDTLLEKATRERDEIERKKEIARRVGNQSQVTAYKNALVYTDKILKLIEKAGS